MQVWIWNNEDDCEWFYDGIMDMSRLYVVGEK